VKLAVSNLAWSPERDERVARLLRELGVPGVELAPTKIWAKPLEAAPGEVAAYRRFWEGHGLSVRALQALLFGRPDLTVFGDEATRQQTLAYLCGMCSLAQELGACVLVFGSPRNRAVDGRTATEVEPVAVEFFGRVAEAAERCGVTFCLEPNPPVYGCDYLTRADEAAALVRRVGRPGLGLHLDTACMALAGDAVEEVLPRAVACLRHFHVSEPQLAPVGTGGLDHGPAAAALRECGYAGWISIEMRAAGDGTELVRVEQAVRAVQETYLRQGVEVAA
jgi:D-psicose/D-tagatose/L-ribulose 3-epimerase